MDLSPIILKTKDGRELRLTDWGFHYGSYYVLRADHMFRLLKREKERKDESSKRKNANRY